MGQPVGIRGRRGTLNNKLNRDAIGGCGALGGLPIRARRAIFGAGEQLVAGESTPQTTQEVA